MPAATMNRLNTLTTFEARSRQLDVNDDAQFQSFMRDACAVLEMSEGDIADILSISRPTYNRWINGRSMPHKLMRPSAVLRISKQVAKRIKSYYRSDSVDFSTSGGMVAKSFRD